MAVPNEHLIDAQKLQADAYVDLFEINLYPTGVMYLCASQAVTWQTKVYQYWGIRMAGSGMSSDEEVSRPRLSIANFIYDSGGNPVRGVFSALNAQNKVEGGSVIRNRVLSAHLASNANIAEQKQWKIARVLSLDEDMITLELRNTLDGPRFTLPARKFIPPDFPQVKLY